MLLKALPIFNFVAQSYFRHYLLDKHRQSKSFYYRFGANNIVFRSKIEGAVFMLCCERKYFVAALLNVNADKRVKVVYGYSVNRDSFVKFRSLGRAMNNYISDIGNNFFEFTVKLKSVLFILLIQFQICKTIRFYQLKWGKLRISLGLMWI